MKRNSRQATQQAAGNTDSNTEHAVKPITRNSKALQHKADTHSVFPIRSGVYRVISGSSGSEYKVVMFDDLSGNCNCRWGTARPEALAANNGAVGCSHVLAVIAHIAQGKGYRISTWNDVTTAQRQHKRIISAADGILVTQRSGTGKRVQADFLGLVDVLNIKK